MNARLLAMFALLAGTSLSVRADGDIEWRHRVTQGAVTLSANPLDPASRTAFYSARGFAADAIRPYAQACGFSFGMQNGGAATLSTRLADWHAVGADGRVVRLRLPGKWDTAMGQGASSRAGAHRLPLGAVPGGKYFRRGRLDHGHGDAGSAAARYVPSHRPLP